MLMQAQALMHAQSPTLTNGLSPGGIVAGLSAFSAAVLGDAHKAALVAQVAASGGVGAGAGAIGVNETPPSSMFEGAGAGAPMPDSPQSDDGDENVSRRNRAKRKLKWLSSANVA
jgi:hypothetical protein